MIYFNGCGYKVVTCEFIQLNFGRTDDQVQMAIFVLSSFGGEGRSSEFWHQERHLSETK